jgi:hypothetical protein
MVVWMHDLTIDCCAQICQLPLTRGTLAQAREGVSPRYRSQSLGMGTFLWDALRPHTIRAEANQIALIATGF